jgi:hypothetical protein
MAKFTGTMVAADGKGLREDLTDMIYNIAPTATPLMSLIGKSKAKAVLHEWQTDTLAAPITTNARAEGNETAFTTPGATVRVGNYVQISDKSVVISGTMEVVDKAGRKSELAYQLAKRSAELKRDMEATIFDNQAAVSSDPRKTGTLGAWLFSNVDMGTGAAANPVYTNLPNQARTDGTTRAFTEVILKSALSKAFTSGSVPTNAFMGATQKALFSAFTGQYTKTFQTNVVKESGNAIIAAADVYVSDFGIIKVVLSRWNRSRDVYIIDPEYMSVMYLRPFQTVDLAKTGDAEKKLLLVEWGVKMNNEAAHASAVDLT